MISTAEVLKILEELRQDAISDANHPVSDADRSSWRLICGSRQTGIEQAITIINKRLDEVLAQMEADYEKQKERA